MGYMEQITEMLGVEVGERFKIEGKGKDSLYYFTENGFFTDNSVECARLFYELMKGNLKIIRIPWKPKLNDYYFCIREDGFRKGTTNWGEIEDIFNIKIGNCFKTEEEITPEIIKKYVDFFNDDERIIKI